MKEFHTFPKRGKHCGFSVNTKNDFENRWRLQKSEIPKSWYLQTKPYNGNAFVIWNQSNIQYQKGCGTQQLINIQALKSSMADSNSRIKIYSNMPGLKKEIYIYRNMCIYSNLTDYWSLTIIGCGLRVWFTGLWQLLGYGTTETGCRGGSRYVEANN